MEGAQGDRLTPGDDAAAPFAPPRADLGGRVVYFPVRHHSPACAWHVDRLIRELRPDAVLIEGPRDASSLIPLLTHQQTKLPVAVYTTYVERPPAGAPPGAPSARHAAYYPLCDYSPELAAVRAAGAVGAAVRFIDLTYPEMVHAGRREQKAGSLLDEHHLRQSRFLKAACTRAGVRDPDDLWDHLYETSYRDVPAQTFVDRVLTYCALARAGSTEEALAADGTIARERAMAAAVAHEKGRVVIVTGGFHTVALPTTPPGMPPAVKAAPEDAVVVMMRYGFEQLDRLNGYAAGMPSPGFYQRLWEGQDPTEIYVELGRECRERRQEISVADEIAAADHCRRLARLRGHAMPSREDVLDGVRSAFVKGAIDAEGTMVMGIARQLLAGDRVGDVPPEAGLPPIVVDFRDTARRLKIDLDRVRAGECVLDLYRRPVHREISRFFYRLKFLGVPFGELVRGPDFVTGKDLQRVQEAWSYHWSPEAEATLVERSLYGATLEEASAGLLDERFTEGEKHGQGRRADLAAALVLEGCRMGLHKHAPDLLRRTATLVNEDQSFPSLVRAMEELLVLHVSREPLEAHHLTGVADLAGHAYDRACYLIPALAATAEGEEPAVLGAMNAFVQAVRTLGDDDARRDLRAGRLLDLTDAAGDANSALRGGAAGLLFGDGRLGPDDLARRFRGHLLAAGDGAKAGADFLRGLLRTARSSVWQVPTLLADLHATLAALEEEQFIRHLPGLRLAFADLTPQETDRVARAVARHAGADWLDVAASAALSSEDMLRGVEIERRMAASLKGDGLEAWFG